MDTSAYLKRQGWRGDGHSLDVGDRGISRPLLVSRKVDVLGLGVNKHAAVSDQWWMRAFDQGLQNFGTGKESTLLSVKKHGVSKGGLYGRFVRGESVPGTIGTNGWSSWVTTGEEPAMSVDTRVEEQELSSQKTKKRRADTDVLREEGADETMGEQDGSLERSVTDRSTKSKASTNHKMNTRQKAEDIPQAASALDTKSRKRISTAKLSAYQKRAHEKGITIEEYVKRREKKYASKKHKKSKRPP